MLGMALTVWLHPAGKSHQVLGPQPAEEQILAEANPSGRMGTMSTHQKAVEQAVSFSEEGTKLDSSCDWHCSELSPGPARRWREHGGSGCRKGSFKTSLSAGYSSERHIFIYPGTSAPVFFSWVFICGNKKLFPVYWCLSCI